MTDQDFNDILPSILTAEDSQQSEESGESDTVADAQIQPEVGEADTISQPSNDKPSETDTDPVLPDTSPVTATSELRLDSTPLFGCPVEVDNSRSGWGVLGMISGQVVRMDLQYPKLMAIFGQIRSGKSYLAGVLTEMSAMRLSGINEFERQESAVVVFNYRKSREARFEYWSFVHKNDSLREINILRDMYSALPTALPQDNFQICAYSRELPHRNENEYAGTSSFPLLFKSENLEDEDWMLLMGLPDPDRVYIQVMRNIVEDLGYKDMLSLPNLRIEVDRATNLNKSQKSIAHLRLDFATRYIDDVNGLNWGEIIRPGTVTVIDLRRRQGRADDALRLCLVVLSAIRNLSRDFHKFVLFDEFHEYYDSSFSQSLDNVARMAGHQNWSICLATQNTHKVDLNLLRLFTNKFVFQVDTTTWNNLAKADERLTDRGFEEIASLQRERGECYALLDDCTDSRFRGVPIKLNVRPRATKHGGTTAGQEQ